MRGDEDVLELGDACRWSSASSAKEMSSDAESDSLSVSSEVLESEVLSGSSEPS